jgi:predicted nucleic acid-binding protein
MSGRTGRAHRIVGTGAHRRSSHRAIAEQIVPLLEAEAIVLLERATLVRALELYGSHSRLDFADAYLAAAALEAGPAAVASFDTDLDAIEGVRRIAS